MMIRQGDIFVYSGRIYVVEKIKNTHVRLTRIVRSIDTVTTVYFMSEVKENFVKLTI